MTSRTEVIEKLLRNSEIQMCIEDITWTRSTDSTGELKHARFLDADGNRKRTFCVPGQWCVPDFYSDHLQ